MAATRPPPESTSVLPNSLLPPSVSLPSPLAFTISLPEEPHIIYATYTLAPTPQTRQGDHPIEQARRRLVAENHSLTLIQSFLPSVHIASGSQTLYIFRITSRDRIQECLDDMQAFGFDSLLASETSIFTPRDLYPCYASCASQRKPCTTCPPSRSQTRPQTSASCLLPREPLRRVHCRFVEAIRERLIDDVCEVAGKNGHGRQVRRLKQGFVLGRPGMDETGGDDWTRGWEQHALRPLIHGHIDVSLSEDRLMIHPILKPTPYTFLHSPSLYPAGTPISLLPFAAPAYFLANYHGPTRALNTLFREALIGHGAGDWEAASNQEEDSEGSPRRNKDQSSRNAGYVLAWVSVQNKKGEDKGMHVVWPRRLCLGFAGGNIVGYEKEMEVEVLGNLPELPLQHSLILPEHSVRDRISAGKWRARSTVLRKACPTGQFQSLSLSARGVGAGSEVGVESVAREVGGYIDAVARERERERERIRKEREMANGSPTKVGATSLGAGTFSLTESPGCSGGLVQSPSGPGHESASSGLEAVTTAQAVNAQVTQGASALPSQSIPIQHFYPSPPMSNPAPSTFTDTATSPAVARTPAPLTPDAPAAAAAPQHAPLLNDEPTSPTTFDADPFANLDSTWSQSNDNDDFMSMGIGFNEGFSMNLTLTGGGARTGGTFDRVSGMDYDDAFTEDDFDFFDRPSNIKPAPIPFPAPPRTSNLNAVVAASSAGFPTAISPSLLGDGFQSSGPGPPTMTPGPHSSPWTFGEGFTPNVPHDGAPSAPENLPSTPGESAMHSVPTTPTVNLVHEFDHHPTNAKRLAEFDPIPFASTHRISDGKYTMGKFALPSPPDEEDGTESTLDASPNDDGWKIRYNACTDPRVGVVKKLLGVKRKILDQGMRVSRKLPSWLTDYDDAEVGNGDLMDDAKSEKDSEDDLDNTHGSQPTSHLSAPLPSYLPLGPHLIQTQFHHSQLLPLCLPSKAPGSSIPPTNIAVAAPINVPTPVSPAAMIGAASEKSRSLETTASIIAKEVVENSLWGDVWLTNVVGSTVHGELCHADISAVQRSLADIDYIEGPVDLTTLSELKQVSPPRKQTLQELRPPLITVGKGDAVVQVLPTALRFWEKLGLSPRGGRKDVDAFVLFEADGEERIQQVKSWLTCFSAAYAAKHLGAHVPGTSSTCPQNGILPLRFESFRKTLASLVTSLPASEVTVIFYIVTPTSIMSLASPVLRQVCSSINRLLQGSGHRMHVHFLPERVVFGCCDKSTSTNPDLHLLCFTVYDRVLRPVDRQMSRRFFEHGTRTRDHFQETAFALARPVDTRVKYHRLNPMRPSDVVDRHTMLHIAYQWTSCGKWVVAAVIDQRGETYASDVWLFDSSCGEKGLVDLVWGFAVKFGRRANVGWRLVIAKLGGLSDRELDAWISHLDEVFPSRQELPMVHVTLLSVENNIPWAIVDPHGNVDHEQSLPPPKEKEASPTVFIDESATTYVMSPSVRIPVSASPCTRDITPYLQYIPDPDSDTQSTSDALGILPLACTTLVRISPGSTYDGFSMIQMRLLYIVEAQDAEIEDEVDLAGNDIAQNYHELCLLSGMRTGKDVLPWHLRAVASMGSALGRLEVAGDCS